MSITSFVEIRLEIGKDYGAVGGPEFNTTVIEMGSGREVRSSNHSNNLGRWELGSRNLVKSDFEYIRDFYRARRGMAQGFRYKDWANFDVTDQNAYPVGSKTIQLVKDFVSGSEADQMTIQKPIAAGFSMKRGGGAFTDFTLDTTTGIITLTTPDWTGSITAITKASQGVVTITAHGRSNGDELYLSAIGGMTELNGVTVTLSNVTADTFQIDVDTTNFTTYTSGGSAEKYVQSSETLTWTGEFDTPIRFDSDQFRAEFIHFRDSDGQAVFNLQSLPIVGLKL